MPPGDEVPGIAREDLAGARLDPTTETEDNFQAPDEHEPLADARVRPLVERFAAAAGATLTDLGDGLVELRVPPEFRPAFRDREQVRIAFSLAALERDPEAEIAVVGGALVEQLIAAVRMQGARVAYGLVPPAIEPSPEAATLGVPVTNGRAEPPAIELVKERLVRLLARVVVRAGGTVEEHLVEGGIRSATTGARIEDDVSAQCLTLVNGPSNAEEPSLVRSSLPPLAPVLAMDQLVALTLEDLRSDLASRVEALRLRTADSLRAELHRIDVYYRSLLDEASGFGADVLSAETRRVYEAEHARRRAEEERRHQVRVIVHPVQVADWEVIAQHARWELVSATGHRAPLVAQRLLSGSGEWSLSCPQCGAASPSSLAVCDHDHVACATCALQCGVCAETFCWDHGLRACHVDGRPACAEHARSCASCREPYCVAHEGVCAEGEHPVCSECPAACAVCARVICDRHAVASTAEAPFGARRLCGECVRYCEGGTNEPVGRDEVTRCASCERYVCAHHEATCAVDWQVHCSKHLRRTDSSRRLVCEGHRAACALESGAILGSDEVAACRECGRSVCLAAHVRTCVECGVAFCVDHAVELRDRPETFACGAHHTVCHIDGVAYSMAGTAACPVCERRACAAHSGECGWCGRVVCASELDRASGRCLTCRRLAPDEEPADDILAASYRVLAEGARVKAWKTARDARHVVVEVDLGWRRRVVFAVRHGLRGAESGRSHSLLGGRSLAIQA